MTALQIITKIQPVLAVKTLAAIEQGIIADGGSRFRGILRDTIAKVEDAYREEKDEYRSHLGASIIGNDCLREVWYQFRWANPEPSLKTKNITHGQMLRLMNRGHLEEARFVALLKMIGVEVWQHDEQGQQFRILAHGGHFGGSVDSVLLRVPDCPDIPLLGEYKTHNDDSFSQLESHGVRESHPKHYIQMQMYMGGWQLRGALYLAVNKDNDDLYGELVEFNPEFFLERSDKARRVIFESPTPPVKVSETPGWWKCKMCRMRFICHKLENDKKVVPEPARNCRTCVYSKPVEGGWVCTNGARPGNFGEGIPLDKADQIKGCELYQVIRM